MKVCYNTFMATEVKTKRSSRLASEKWRNVYWLDRLVQMPLGPAGPGRFVARYAWPSRDIAETKALESLNGPRNPDPGRIRYLGAEKQP